MTVKHKHTYYVYSEEHKKGSIVYSVAAYREKRLG